MAQDYVPAAVPMAGKIISTILQMTTFGVLCVAISRRSPNITKLKSLPLALWLLLIIYVDSTLFVYVTALLINGFGINSSRGICEGGIILCLVCYMTTKILIYYFLVERVYIVRGSRTPRLKTKLWLFNCIFMLLPYTIFVVMNFVWRITYIDKNGVCIIGMQMKAMMPLIIFEVIVNIYLTLLFILPLRKLYTYQHGQNTALHRMTSRSLVSSIATLITSVANLTVSMVLRGEPGWICLMLCNADILFCVLVLHWVTSKERREITTYTTAVTEPSSSFKRRNSFRDVETLGKNVLEDDPITPSYTSSTVLRKDWSYDGTVVNEPLQVLKLPSTVTTECRGGPQRPLGRGNASHTLQKSSAKKEGNEGAVELRSIHVTTDQIFEVEVDTEAEGQSADEEIQEWPRSSSTEKMVRTGIN